MIAIVDHGAGNIKSVQNMLSSIGSRAVIASAPEQILSAERLIIPGVGHFDQGMDGLNRRGLIPALNRRVVEDRVPVLGICLGAQMIARRSQEGTLPGLGWIDADVVAFDRARMERPLQVPHMGWEETWVAPNAAERGGLADVMLRAVPNDARYYFVHSFHLECDRPETAPLRAFYGYEFAAGVVRDNVLGLQFHPEKSHRFGKALFEAFMGWNPKIHDRKIGAA